MGLTRANQTSFKKGFKPWNTGKKGLMPKQCGFQKGHKKLYKISPVLGKHWKLKKYRKSSMGMLNKKHNDNTKSKMSIAHGGTGIPQRPTKRYYHLRDKKYFEWRSKVFARDNWTCQTCFKRGIRLEPHHIKGWAKYPELRYELNNGVSLCYECHKLTRKKHYA